MRLWVNKLILVYLLNALILIQINDYGNEYLPKKGIYVVAGYKSSIYFL